MDIYNETGMAFAPLFGGKVRFPSHSLSLIVKGTYRMTPGGEPVLLEEQPLPTGDIPYETDANAVRYPSDFSYFKPKGEVLLAGHAHAPGKKPSPKVNAGFQAGGLVKALRILGNRFQKASLLPSKASEPEPFEKMEIG
ncbi:MAG: DUF2169 domain-containing protein, partial [Planctomycetota bacterium]|nr:DUF2169 domain-containing protein [Planctomycetota bacterium]